MISKHRSQRIIDALIDLGRGATTAQIARRTGLYTEGVFKALRSFSRRGVTCLDGKDGEAHWEYKKEGC